MFKRLNKLSKRKQSLVVGLAGAGLIFGAIGIGLVAVASVATMVG